MRYGVISDVHGNLHALHSALDVFERARVDRLLCLGDLVGFGPFPNECVREVAALDAVSVAGNHDLIALGRLSVDRCSRLAADSLRWTTEVLAADVRRHLEALPLLATAGPEIVMAHGALGDPQRYIRRSEDAIEQLDQLAREHSSAEVLLLGHTHRTMIHGHRSGNLLIAKAPSFRLPVGEPFLINPGSAGQSRERSPYGRVAVIDTFERTVTLHAVRYDVAATRRALRARGRPAGSCHRRPYGLAASVRRARGLLGATRRRLLATGR